MEVISLIFACFSIITIFVYYLVDPKWRVLLLTVLSLGFILTYNFYLAVYVIIFALINFLLGRKLHTTQHKARIFRVGIGFNLLQLLVLKYSGFIIDPVLDLMNASVRISQISSILVPIGISYLTLQGIGYLVNIKMGWEKPEEKFFNFLLYITYFPKFLAGPIERSNHFLPMIRSMQCFSQSRVTEGLRIALFGFFKKIVIANQLAPIVNNVYANIDFANGPSILLLILVQPLYLYFDFSGYTDIAIGFSKALGIDLLPNFNRPFFSENMTAFWKRFHMSLSSWFNDYVFKQTSFNLRSWGILASIYALLITWTQFGIWHGAGWNFMLLGFLQALAIIYEFFSKKWRIRTFSKMPSQVKLWMSRILTYLFYGTSLVFFFSPDIGTTLTLFENLFSQNNIVSVTRIIPLRELAIPLLFVSIILGMEFLDNDFKYLYNKIRTTWIGTSKRSRLLRVATYYLIMLLIFICYKQIQEFIYFQF